MPEVDKRDPLAILRKLYAELIARRPTIAKTVDYYDGAHNLAFASEKFLEAFGGLFRAFADNWCGVVTDAVEERLQVNGFRVNSQPKADENAKRIWEENELDLQGPTGHLDGLIAGAFYVTAWQRDEAGTTPEITVESASSTIVECHPKIRRRRTSGLRTWLAEDGFEHAELFVPKAHEGGAAVYLYRSRSKRTSGFPGGPRSEWSIEDQLDVAGELDVNGSMANPTGVVPIVEFLNRPRLTTSRRAGGWGTHSEIASIIPLQDAVNKLIADMLIGSEFSAIPQRNLTGYTPDDELDAEGQPTGKILPPKFRNGPGNLWWTDEIGAKFGQFAAADLGNFVKAIELIVQHIASISSTPPHYLRASADRLSGESIKAAETGLVSKALRKQRTWGAGWEEVMRIAGGIAGISELATAQQMETIWRDPETRTEAEHIDALGKKAQMLNVPDMQLWEEAGYSPEQIARFPAMRAQSQLEGMAANAAERARLATQEADALRRKMINQTGGLPVPELELEPA